MFDPSSDASTRQHAEADTLKLSLRTAVRGSKLEAKKSAVGTTYRRGQIHYVTVVDVLTDWI